MTRPPQDFTAALETVGIAIDEPTIRTLERYLDHLLETNRRTNLTAVRDPETAWLRHVLDSLSLVPCLPNGARLIDVGSGGGLPGLVLAIARPDVRVTLLEATGKKATFCRDAAQMLELGNVTVVHERAETAAHAPAHRAAYDVVTARAVTELRELLELTLPFAREGGILLAMKGRTASEEIAASTHALATLGGSEPRVVAALPGVRDDAVIVEVTKVAPTPEAYPRAPGRPAKRPL